MEPPECPVCLQAYDGDSTTPRVLPCGHSACETCLPQLPNPHPHTIRCPACTQLVKCHVATALPKNIDLLRVSLHLLDLNPTSQRQPRKESRRQRPRFIPQIWSEELYSAWKDWVLPKDDVLLERRTQEVGIFSVSEAKLARISSSTSSGSASFSPLRCRLKDDQGLVGLVKVGFFHLDQSSEFEYSYVGGVMSVLARMTETERTELASMLSITSRNFRVSKIYGLWFDVESASLYLISERKHNNLSKLLDLTAKISDDVLRDTAVMDRMSYLAVVGLELCEALISLHLEGLLCGCLGLSCLCFDEFGHVYVDLNEVLSLGRKLHKCVAEAMNGGEKFDNLKMEELIADIVKTNAFLSPELLFQLLLGKGVPMGKTNLNYTVDFTSDVWSVACLLLRLLIGKQFSDNMFNYLKSLFEATNNELVSQCKAIYTNWMANVTAMSEASAGVDLMSLQQILCTCLNFDPGKRPLLIDVWKSLKCLVTKPHVDTAISFKGEGIDRNVHCLVLGELCGISSETRIVPRATVMCKEKGHGNDGEVFSQGGEVGKSKHLVEGLSVGKVEFRDMENHLDRVTGFLIGGGFLFSSSFDKTIIVWSLQDFTRVHTFRGHEHRIMAVTFLDEQQPMCISGDSGGGIFVWAVTVPFGQEPLKKWYEQQDWRYSGIHALAVSGTGFLFTGSGDRLIKAWSLMDCTLSSTMEGHKSVVSALAVSDSVLYSGSWDGTVRLWSLHDYSPLAMLGEDMAGTVSSVLSLYADQQTVIATYENGCIKMWINDVLQRSSQDHNGAIFSLNMHEKWLFTGGWDKTVKVLEIQRDEFQIDIRPVGSIMADSVITALLYGEGKLFVGFANGLIKVYQHKT